MYFFQDASDNRDCENRLVDLLSFDQFAFIKKLIQNRNTVLYCTLLAQAQSQEEREKIEDKMQSDPKLSVILHSLWETSTSDEKMEHSGISERNKPSNKTSTSQSKSGQPTDADFNSTEGEKVNSHFFSKF